MKCKPQAEVFEDIPIKNSGDVPVIASVSISNKYHYLVTPDVVDIKPGQIKVVRLTFLSSTLASPDQLTHWYVPV